MNEKEKELYKQQMKAKAIAYAEDQLSDVKGLMPEDDYQECVGQFANAFIAGADAAVSLAKEFSAN